MNQQLIEIGMRLMTLREICEISIEEMAEKCGISVLEYSSYEKGERDFSISFLYSCAQTLGVDVLDLMSGDSPKLSVCTVVKKGDGYCINRDNAYDYEHLAFTFRNKKAEPFRVRTSPSDAPVFHVHEGQEMDYLLSGKLRFYIDDYSYELEPGDCVYFDARHPHAELAIGDGEAEFIAVVIK
ncbi:MAG: helix-turn-helix transcriptional regulator [Ruminococcaceae bacterium]|nr:helix-turn-helix transcriptional regulator [Oscillospiraceae bacterium]